jgi:recombination protein RecA
MGDGALSPSQGVHAARFRWAHGHKQIEYGDWMRALFGNIDVSRSVRESDGAVFFDMTPLPELAELREAVYVDDKKVFSDDYLKRLTPLSLAVWYMDDGTFTLRSKGLQQRTKGGSGRSEICVQAMEPTTRVRLMNYLSDTWGIRPKLTSQGGQAVLQFPTAETAKFHALIAPFVHPTMQYKLLPRYRGVCMVEPHFMAMRYELVPMPILDIRPKAPSRHTHRFDIEVEGTHNYFAGGVMVHNSPEVTPGGRALKFYSSVRLDIRRIESIKDGVEVIGNRTRVKVVKCKVSPPFRQAEFDIMYGQGISREGSLLDVGVDMGFVKKSGAWYTYEGEQLGQGREKAKEFLRDNPELMVTIYARICEQAGIGADATPADEVPLGEGAGDDEPILIDDSLRR